MFKIGQLAKLADVTPDTIRYYEKQGMMDHNVRGCIAIRICNAYFLSAMPNN